MKRLIGIVVSTSMTKTAVVKVDTLTMHPLYKKRVKHSKKHLAHTEKKLKVGDRVVLQSTRPLSRRKHWRVSQVLKK